MPKDEPNEVAPEASIVKPDADGSEVEKKGIGSVLAGAATAVVERQEQHLPHESWHVVQQK